MQVAIFLLCNLHPLLRLSRSLCLSPPLHNYVKPNASDKGGLLTASVNILATLFPALPREVGIRVYSADSYGFQSLAPLDFVITNPIPAVRTFTLTAMAQGIQINITPTTETDSITYIIYEGSTANFAKDSTTITYTGTDRKSVV